MMFRYVTCNSDTAGFPFCFERLGKCARAVFHLFSPTPSLSPLFLGVLCSCCDFDYVGENLFWDGLPHHECLSVSRIFLKQLSYHFFFYGIEKQNAFFENHSRFGFEMKSID